MDFDSFEQLVKANRSCRRFDASHLIDRSTLEQLVNLARQTASAANMQPLKYIICTDIEKKQRHFLNTWLGHIPEKLERPLRF
jgi:nitroreductase